MKKWTTLLALFLALLMTLSAFTLVSCKGDKPGEHGSDTSDTSDTGDTSDTSDTQDTSDTADTADTGDTEDTGAKVEPTVEAVDKTMYMTGQPVSVTVRKKTDLGSEAVGYLSNGDAVHVYEIVTAINTEVWAHVNYKNSFGETVTGYLLLFNLSDTPAAPEPEPEIEDADLVKFIARTLPSGAALYTLSVREKPSFEASTVGSVTRDQQVRQTGIVKEADEDGTVFARIEFTDETGATLVGFINSKCLLDAIEQTGTEIPFETTDLVRYIAQTLPSGARLETLSVRSAPSFSSSVVGVVKCDQEVKQIAIATAPATAEGDEGTIFAKIKFIDETGATCTGYVNAKCLTDGQGEGEDEPDYDPTGVTLYVTGSVNMRNNPSLTDSQVLLSLAKDTEVLEIGRMKEADAAGIIWSYVSYTKPGTEEAIKGFVSSKYLATEIVNESDTQ